MPFFNIVSIVPSIHPQVIGFSNGGKNEYSFCQNIIHLTWVISWVIQTSYNCNHISKIATVPTAFLTRKISGQNNEAIHIKTLRKS